MTAPLLMVLAGVILIFFSAWYRYSSIAKARAKAQHNQRWMSTELGLKIAMDLRSKLIRALLIRIVGYVLFLWGGITILLSS